MKYNHKKIEKKWQDRWAKTDLHKARDDGKNDIFVLDMFPYPSGAGLHVGHVESYTATDIYSRYLRMQGHNVLHPQGWDAFGLPAENYAIKTNIHPSQTTSDAINTFKRQINSLGFSYDWDREINSSDPAYYKWTQWLFLLLYKNGLAFKKKAKVNWCNSCQTVLANEQAEGGRCERCHSEVVQKDLEQWFFRITDFLEDQTHKGKALKGLISGLDSIDWPESTKIAQKNWIGRSVGAEVDFMIAGEKVTVFTTRPDTLYGATYFVLSPEHPLIDKYKTQIKNYDEVRNYIEKANKKTELERTDLAKEKTGIELKGLKAVNPVNNQEIPVWVADYVMMGYGTGAIMAVPAHDERDHEFAKKYNLDIRQVVTPDLAGYKKTLKLLEALAEIKKSADRENIKFWIVGGLGIPFYTGVIYREHSDLDLMVKDREEYKKFIKILEDLGYKKKKEKILSDKLINSIYKNGNGVEIDIGPYVGESGITDEDFINEERELSGVKCRVISEKYLKDLKEKQLKRRNKEKDRIDYEYLGGKVFTGDGFCVNSGQLDSLTTRDGKKKMIDSLVANGLGKAAINYKIRDWLVSRQRYWGAPIPIIYCDKCGQIPVPEKDLPVKLPTDVDFKPTGESPLKYSKDFQKVKCPKCGAPARRESDTMDTFVCSSWYYLRYADPNNDKEFAGKKLLKKWLPVDIYVGGAEHSVLHLLYSRFFTKVLQKYGYVEFNEPFLKLRHQGIILAGDGTKMSKSKGNVINPDEVIEKYGADALRMYEMFMGPLEDMKPWDIKGILGIKRFLYKVYDYFDLYATRNFDSLEEAGESMYLPLLNKTIKKVTEDISNFKFNTAIAQMMILINKLRESLKDDSEKETGSLYTFFNKAENMESILLILSPFAPHLAEELWHKLGHKDSIAKEKWPKYDKKLVKDETIKFVIQVNGRLRETLETGADITESEAKELALKSEKIRKWINGKDVKKIIFVKGKLINIVIG